MNGKSTLVLIDLNMDWSPPCWLCGHLIRKERTKCLVYITRGKQKQQANRLFTMGDWIVPWCRTRAVELSANWHVACAAWAMKWLQAWLWQVRLPVESRKRSTTWRRSGKWGCTCGRDNTPIGVGTRAPPPDTWNYLHFVVGRRGILIIIEFLLNKLIDWCGSHRWNRLEGSRQWPNWRGPVEAVRCDRRRPKAFSIPNWKLDRPSCEKLNNK